MESSPPPIQQIDNYSRYEPLLIRAATDYVRRASGGRGTLDGASAEDFVQLGFQKAIQAKGLSPDGDLTGYLLVVLRNLILNSKRRRAPTSLSAGHVASMAAEPERSDPEGVEELIVRLSTDEKCREFLRCVSTSFMPSGRCAKESGLSRSELSRLRRHVRRRYSKDQLREMNRAGA